MQFLTLLILSCILADMNLIASRSVHVSDEDVQDETVPAGTVDDTRPWPPPGVMRQQFLKLVRRAS